MANEVKKLVDRKDILNDLLNVITPKYFPDETLDKNRTSIYGYITEVMANSIEDTITLEQRRAADYCPELSNSEIHVRQTAKIRGVGVNYATPGRAFAIIGILKSDIIERGVRNGNQVTFTIDRRSTIIHNGINFSLNDDIIIRAVRRAGGYVYAANYSGEYSTSESYIQMFEQIDELGQELVSMIVQVYQFNYNIQEKVVTDEIEFLYDGIEFDYSNLLADFDVYFKQTTNDTYKKLEKDHYLTTETTDAIYYNDDDPSIIYILNNPSLNIFANATIKIEIKETLGTDGMVAIGDERTTFSLYRDGTYNYSGVNIYINLLSDTTGANNGDTLADIKARLIDAKVRRDNITTEHDIVSYINDQDANVQIIKKRNDIEDRRYYVYTLLRRDGEIVPATTKRLHLVGIQSLTDIGDFDTYNSTVDRKVVKAYNKFKLVTPENPAEEEYLIKVDHDEHIEGEFYYTCPFMMLVNDKNIISYYYNSINRPIQVAMKSIENLFPFQMIIREIHLYRDAHSATDNDIYRFTVTATMNTSNDTPLVNEDNEVIDHTGIMCYIVFRTDNTSSAYLPMEIDSYNPETREFTFVGNIQTTDYITEKGHLEIINGLYKNGTNTNYYSVIDCNNAYFDLYFMYKYDDIAKEYNHSDIIYRQLPDSRTDGYVLMCGYHNATNNPYSLIMEYSKFTSSPVLLTPYTATTVQYSIGEVPVIEYNYGLEHIIDMCSTFEHMLNTYGNLLKLTTDFEVSLKFIATHGRSKYIVLNGGRDRSGKEVQVNLANLNPTFYFKVYGYDIDVAAVRQFIYEYLRDTYITGSTVFMSNICTLVERTFTRVRSIKYMGVDDLDASYQEFIYKIPEFTSVDIITRFIPEQLNVTDIQIELDET